MSVLIFFIALLFFMSFVLLYSVAKFSFSFKKAKDYYVKHKTYKDWFLAGFVALAASFLLFSMASQTKAKDYDWLDYTEIHFGVDYQKDAPVCQSNVENTLTSNAGIQQQIVGKQFDVGRIDLVASYTHNSCAIGEDVENVYDGYGLQVKYRVNW